MGYFTHNCYKVKHPKMEINESLVNKVCALLLIAGIALIAYSFLFGSSAQAAVLGTSSTRSSSSSVATAASNMPSDFTPPSDMGMMAGGMPPG